MVSFVREKKWMNDGLSVVRRGPDNASEVSKISNVLKCLT